MCTNCYYSKTKKTIVTFPHPENSEITMFGSTIEEIKNEYPDIALIPTEQAVIEIEQAFTSYPIEITEKEYDYALNVLPPQNWKTFPDGEYFQMCEYTTGRITAYYAKKKNKFYTFNDIAYRNTGYIMNKLARFN